MLSLKIIVIDKTRSPFLREGESYYLKRIRRYAPLEWVEVKPAKIKKGRSPVEILALEGQATVKKTVPRDYLVALERSGQQYDSLELAAWFEKLSTSIEGRVNFIIGGPLGISTEILKRAQKILSLSRLTMTHEMSRLILLEQIYRAMTIMRGEKYHK